jgi:hypothetical protein
MQEATPSSHDEDGDADFPPCVGWLGSGKEGSAAWISSLIWNPTAHIRRTMYDDDDTSHRDISIVRQQPPEIYMGFPRLPCSLTTSEAVPPIIEGGSGEISSVSGAISQIQGGGPIPQTLLFRHVRPLLHHP